MNNYFNIAFICDQLSVDIQAVAPLLFPRAKFPNLAFSRVLKGDANLDTDQLCVLADFIGVPVSSLFNLEWLKSKRQPLTFYRGLNKVVFDMSTNTAIIYKNDKLIGTKPIEPANINNISRLSSFLDSLIIN